jgi:hypothetical protein
MRKKKNLFLICRTLPSPFSRTSAGTKHQNPPLRIGPIRAGAGFTNDKTHSLTKTPGSINSVLLKYHLHSLINIPQTAKKTRGF